MAIGTQGGRIKMLDVATKTLRFDVEGHNDIVRCVAVIPHTPPWRQPRGE